MLSGQRSKPNNQRTYCRVGSHVRGTTNIEGRMVDQDIHGTAN